MRTLSTHFLIIPAELISEALVLGGRLSHPVGSTEFACTSKILFSQTPANSEAGVSYSQTFRGVTKDRSALRFNGERAYVGMIFTDGSVEVIGSSDEIPPITVTPYEGAFVVEVSFSSPSPVNL